MANGTIQSIVIERGEGTRKDGAADCLTRVENSRSLDSARDDKVCWNLAIYLGVI